VIQESAKSSQEENNQELDIQGLDAIGDAVLFPEAH
jgi:hypothetical protein